jgi:predicted chitinase
MDRQIFFTTIRPLFVHLTPAQVVGIEAKLDEFERRKLTDLRFLAYMLATSYHETGKLMAPVREGFAKSDMAARRIVRNRKYGGEVNGHVYYGRGDVQLTWLKNYQAMGKLLSIPLAENPDLALKPEVSAAIMFEGMLRGSFTAKKLSDYFNDTKTDWVNARRIINGTDKAAMIAGYAREFHTALVLAS